MHITHFHRKSPIKAEAEDAFALHPAAGTFAVMDGVTPLHEYRNDQGHNGAYLAANLLKACFEQSTPDVPLTNIITVANRLLREQMIAAHVDLSILHELWSTCVASVRIEDNCIHYAQLGDSMLVVVYRNGHIVAVTKNRVLGVTGRAKHYRRRARNEGVLLQDESFYEIPENRNAYNRWLANVPEGYGVMNGMEDIETHLQFGTLPLAEIKHVLLLTDGLFHPDLPLEQACMHMMELGYDAYADEVEAAERIKNAAPDDRTGIWISFD
ncbi:MAG: stage sporulation family protein [Paenibacillus sp.]|nr:stage sporulation family protein [Paenibacillus sp.]